jgi:hypothetical protein
MDYWYSIRINNLVAPMVDVSGIVEFTIALFVLMLIVLCTLIVIVGTVTIVGWLPW